MPSWAPRKFWESKGLSLRKWLKGTGLISQLSLKTMVHVRILVTAASCSRLSLVQMWSCPFLAPGGHSKRSRTIPAALFGLRLAFPLNHEARLSLQAWFEFLSDLRPAARSAMAASAEGISVSLEVRCAQSCTADASGAAASHKTRRSSFTRAVVTFPLDLCPNFSFPASVSFLRLDKY